MAARNKANFGPSLRCCSLFMCGQAEEKGGCIFFLYLLLNSGVQTTQGSTSPASVACLHSFIGHVLSEELEVAPLSLDTSAEGLSDVEEKATQVLYAVLELFLICSWPTSGLWAVYRFILLLCFASPTACLQHWAPSDYLLLLRSFKMHLTIIQKKKKTLSGRTQVRQSQ